MQFPFKPQIIDLEEGKERAGPRQGQALALYRTKLLQEMYRTLTGFVTFRTHQNKMKSMAITRSGVSLMKLRLNTWQNHSYE